MNMSTARSIPVEQSPSLYVLAISFSLCGSKMLIGSPHPQIDKWENPRAPKTSFWNIFCTRQFVIRYAGKEESSRVMLTLRFNQVRSPAAWRPSNQVTPPRNNPSLATLPHLFLHFFWVSGTLPAIYAADASGFRPYTPTPPFCRPL
jgi:hypothetical protein